MTASPHGGKLVQLKLVSNTPERRKEYSESPTIRVPDETRVQLLNMATGILSPLTGFLGKADYDNALENSRLASDIPWTIPVLLHVPEDFTAGNGDAITLLDQDDKILGQIEFEELYAISKKVFGTEEDAHPGVAKIYASSDRIVSGKIKSVVKFEKDPFEDAPLSPKETRVLFNEKGWKDVSRRGNHAGVHAPRGLAGNSQIENAFRRIGEYPI